MKSSYYISVIKEDIETLLSEEKKLSIARLRDRVKLIRLLKEGIVPNLKAAAKVVGMSERQAIRMWNMYKKEGLSAITATNYKGKKSKLTEDKEEMLIQQLANKGFENLAEAQSWIQNNLGKNYTVPGVWTLLKRINGKKKKDQITEVKNPKKRK